MEPARRSRAVLVVEPRSTTRDAIHATLFSENVDLVWSADGDDALAKARSLHPLAALVDTEIGPELAYTICRELKAFDVATRVFLLVSLFKPLDRAAASECGADAILATPVNSMELLTNIRRLIAQRSSPTRGIPIAKATVGRVLLWDDMSAEGRIQAVDGREVVFSDSSVADSDSHVFVRGQPVIFELLQVGATATAHAVTKVRCPPVRIFLCHAKCDKAAVRSLYSELACLGADPWLDDEKLLAGQDWELEITKAIRAADLVAVCLTASAVTRTGYVQKEIRHALDVADRQPEGGVFIIPIRLEDCSVPDRISRWQWVDLFQAGGLLRLMQAINAAAKNRSR